MAGATDDAAGGLNGLGLAVELVAEALDVIEAIGYDNVVTGEHSLDGRVLLGTGIFFCLGRVVYPPGQAKRLVVDEVDLEPAVAGIGVLAGDLGLEKVLQLEGTGGLASRGVARDDKELVRYQRTGRQVRVCVQDDSRAWFAWWDRESMCCCSRCTRVILQASRRDDAASRKVCRKIIARIDSRMRRDRRARCVWRLRSDEISRASMLRRARDNSTRPPASVQDTPSPSTWVQPTVNCSPLHIAPGRVLYCAVGPV